METVAGFARLAPFLVRGRLLDVDAPDDAARHVCPLLQRLPGDGRREVR
jgi:hypothetical protein